MGKHRSGHSYQEFPILNVARRCGLVLNDRTLEWEEVEASCPFCGDHGPGKHHLFLNTTRNIFRCVLCGEKGNSVSLYDNLVSDPFIDPLPYCMEAQRLFELYQNCAGRRQIETLLENYVDSMQAVKIGRGHFFFVPRDFAARLQVFEDFVEMLEEHNQLKRPDRDPLEVNSIYVVDDAKQRKKMTAAFYRSVRREIAEYEERVTHLIQSGSQSPKIMDRWVMRIQGLKEKKRNYENIIAFRSHTLWLELALVGLLLLLMAAHGKYSMAVKWAVGYCALLLFQQYILPASPKIIATSFTIFATYARRMFPCLMTGSLMLKCTPLRYFIVGLRQLRVPQRLIVAVSVTLRYFPAIREEMGYIRDAMKLRDVRGLARLEGTVIPLMVSATETAEELSAAAVTRGIEDPAPKTSAVFLRLSPVDLAGMAAGLVLLALSFVVQ